MTEAKSEKPSLLARMKSRQEMNSPTAPKPIKKVEHVAEQPKPKKAKQPATQKPPATYESDQKRVTEARIVAVAACEEAALTRMETDKHLDSVLLAVARYASLRDLISQRWNADGTPKPVAEPKK